MIEIQTNQPDLKQRKVVADVVNWQLKLLHLVHISTLQSWFVSYFYSSKYHWWIHHDYISSKRPFQRKIGSHPNHQSYNANTLQPGQSPMRLKATNCKELCILFKQENIPWGQYLVDLEPTQFNNTCIFLFKGKKEKKLLPFGQIPNR